MLKYTGSANYEKVDIRLFGDGYTKDVSIDLSKPPFNLAFKGFYPKNVVIANVSPGLPKSVTMNGDNLIIIYTVPPTAVEFTDTITAPPENRSVFSLYFVYGTGVAE